MPVQGGRADAGPAGDLLQRGAGPVDGEGLLGGVENALVVAPGIGAQGPSHCGVGHGRFLWSTGDPPLPVA